MNIIKRINEFELMKIKGIPLFIDPIWLLATFFIVAIINEKINIENEKKLASKKYNRIRINNNIFIFFINNNSYLRSCSNNDS